MKKLGVFQLRDVIYGSAFLGAGGGGSIVQGLNIVQEISIGGKEVVLVEVDEVLDDEMAVVSAGMGSPQAARHGWRNENLPAFDMLERFIGKEIRYVVPIEIGAGNVAVPAHTAAFRNRVLVDGDGAGRAIPELELTSFNIFGVPISPMAISDYEGNGGILFVKNATEAEKISRHITIAFEGVAGIALYPMRGDVSKKVVIPNTISLSLKVGEILRKAKDSKLDVTRLLVDELNAYILGTGVVVSKRLQTLKGFDFGVVEVKTNNNRMLRVHFKNENIIAEYDGEVVALAPDLICWTTLDGNPLTNVDVEAGMKVAVVGLKASEKLRSVEALPLFKHLYEELGFNVEYKPIEKLPKII